MTTIAPKPDWAPSIYQDSNGKIYLQFSQDVYCFEITNMSKLLKMVPKVEAQAGYISGRQNIADHVLNKPIKLAKKTERERLLKAMSPERRARLQEMIRRANIKENK